MTMKKLAGPGEVAQSPAKNVSSDPKRLRVLFVVAHDSLGGAARATFRVFDAIRTWCPDQIDIFMRTPNKTRDDNAILGGKPVRNRWETLEYLIRTRFRKYFPRRPFVSDNTLLHSQALYKSGLAREINALNPDVVLMGWLGNSTLSIEEIKRIKAPIVWRLSDMWVFSGAEHYSNANRHRRGYSRASRPLSEHGPDINRETFLRKRRSWTKPSHIIALSTWLSQEANQSILTARWPLHIVPVPIDTDLWTPQDRLLARKKLGLPARDKVILYGSGGGTRRAFKGSGYLFKALQHLNGLLTESKSRGQVRLVIFGESGDEQSYLGFSVTYLGRLNDHQLALAYSAADVTVVPSSLEAFGQVAAEAQACGSPVVAFGNSGLADVVIDEVTGKLARPFDARHLAQGIIWCLASPSRSRQLREASRFHAQERWNPERVAGEYARILQSVATGEGNGS